MGRIQQILEKASREGLVHRTTADVAPPAPLSVKDAGTTLVAPRTGAHRSRGPAPHGPVAAQHHTTPGADLESQYGRPIHGAQTARAVVAALAPNSTASEHFRSLRASLVRRDAVDSLRTLLVTSPGPGEGKTFTAVNLAVTMAQEPQSRILILDCDFRKPRVHALFGVSQSPGLADVLAGTMVLEDVLAFLPEHRLSIVTAGSAPAGHVELIGSPRFRKLLDTLRTRFDRIVLDSPPATVVADASALAPFTDGVVLVVRSGHTTQPTVTRALAGFDQGKVLGFVLNESASAAVAAQYGYEHEADTAAPRGATA